jgi:hypothetical protein
MKNLTLFIFALIIAAFLFSCNEKKGDPGNEKGVDTVAYEIINKEESYGDCDSTYRDCLQLKVTYPEFKGIDNIFIEKEIENEMNSFLFASFYEGNNLGTFNDLMDNYINQYSKMLDGAPQSTQGWDVDRKVTVIYNKNNILSLQYFEFSFTGGAHPNTYQFYDNFNIKSGSKIKLNDLLKPGSMDSLTNIAETKFREMKGLSPSESLKSAGFAFDENKFELTNNFGIAENGLVFFYNTYEIAPYAMGSTELLLPYSDISTLFKDKFTLN